MVVVFIGMTSVSFFRSQESVSTLQLLDGDVRVDLGRRQLHVTQDGLDEADADPPFEIGDRGALVFRLLEKTPLEKAALETPPSK